MIIKSLFSHTLELFFFWSDLPCHLLAACEARTKGTPTWQEKLELKPGASSDAMLWFVYWCVLTLFWRVPSVTEPSECRKKKQGSSFSFPARHCMKKGSWMHQGGSCQSVRLALYTLHESVLRSPSLHLRTSVLRNLILTFFRLRQRVSFQPGRDAWSFPHLMFRKITNQDAMWCSLMLFAFYYLYLSPRTELMCSRLCTQDRKGFEKLK